LIYFFFNFENSFLSFSKLFGPPHIMDIFSIKVLIEKQRLEQELIGAKKEQHEMTRQARVLTKNTAQYRDEVDRLNRELGRALKQGELWHREIEQNEDLIGKLKDELNALLSLKERTDVEIRKLNDNLVSGRREQYEEFRTALDHEKALLGRMNLDSMLPGAGGLSAELDLNPKNAADVGVPSHSELQASLGRSSRMCRVFLSSRICCAFHRKWGVTRIFNSRVSSTPYLPQPQEDGEQEMVDCQNRHKKGQVEQKNALQVRGRKESTRADAINGLGFAENKVGTSSNVCSGIFCNGLEKISELQKIAGQAWRNSTYG